MNLPVAHLTGIFAPLELLPMLIAAALYARRATTLAARGRPVPLWRQICFAAGLLVIAGALITPLSDLADELVIAHMIEHLLIGDIASLLIVLGLTGPLLQPILAIPVFDRLRVLCHPVVAMSIWAITIFAWHAPPLYDAAYGNSAVHFLEHGMFIIVGVLLWMPVFGPLPMPAWFTAGWKVVYVIVMRLIATVLGNILMWDGQVLYDVYAKGEARHHIEALTDQSIAGVVMMVEGVFLGLGVLAWFFFQAATEGIEKQRLLDLAYANGVELDPARAQRAVAAGPSARERLEAQILADAERGKAAVP
ncbi:MAG TPA: cytochrome c oxidase assembly protein [Solirubrobacterales bacterium]|nr:cytochrome c oxidase assembly protein [Solirubrobacterales bacterium]